MTAHRGAEGAVDGTRTRDLRCDRPVLLLLSYDGTVRALGLEPSLVRGKSPVPYQSGVARSEWAGRESNPLCPKTAGLQPAAPHGATDPRAGPGGADPIQRLPMRLSRNDCPDWKPGAHARKESNPQPTVLETAAPPWLERKR